MPRTLPITWHPDAIRAAVRQLLTVLGKDKPDPDTLGLLNDEYIAGMHWWCLIDLCRQVLADLDDESDATPSDAKINQNLVQPAPVVDTDLRALTALIEHELQLAADGEGYEPLAVAEQIIKDHVAPVLAERNELRMNVGELIYAITARWAPGESVNEQVSNALRILRAGDEEVAEDLDELETAQAQIERLQLEIQGYQVGGGYEKGHEHGSAESARLKANWEAARTANMVALETIAGLRAELAGTYGDDAPSRTDLIAQNVRLLVELRDRNRAYGRASATIGELRGALARRTAEYREASEELADIHGDDAPSRIDLAADNERLRAYLDDALAMNGMQQNTIALRCDQITDLGAALVNGLLEEIKSWRPSTPDVQPDTEAARFFDQLCAECGQENGDHWFKRGQIQRCPDLDTEATEQVPHCGEGPHGAVCDEPVPDGFCSEHGEVGQSVARATPTEPRVWRKGDPEPPESIQVLVDCKDDHLPYLCRVRNWWQWFEKPADRFRAPGGVPWREATAVMGSGAKDYVVALTGAAEVVQPGGDSDA